MHFYGPQQAKDFLKAVHGESIDAGGGVISIHTLRPLQPGEDRRPLSTRWFDTIDAAGEHAATVGKAGTGNEVYVGACLQREKPKSGRGTRDMISAVPGFWADIDVGTEAHRGKAYPPNYDAACEILALTGLKPTLVVHSGYGLWGWWTFVEPVIIDDKTTVDRIAELARRWHLTVQACARSLTYNIDSVFDMTRIARMPGTFNHKRDARNIKPGDLERGMTAADPIAAHIYDRPGVSSGTAYQIEELERFMVAPELFESTTPAHQRIEVGAVMLSPDRYPDGRVIEAGMANDPIFAKTWNRTRTDLKDQSSSGYDLAMCNWAVKCSLSDQAMADLMIGFRTRHQLDMSKSMRRDYVQRTIAKAKAMGQQQEAMKRLTEDVSPIPPSPLPSADGAPTPTASPGIDPRRKQVLDDLTKALWGVQVLRFLQVGRENSLYYVVIGTPEGPKEIKIGALPAVRDPIRFCEPITNWNRVALPKFKAQTWEGIYRNLLAICEMVDTPELHDNVTGRGYVMEYLRRASIATDGKQVADAIERARPFAQDGRMFIHAETLRRHLRQRQDITVTTRDLTHYLRQAGFASKPVSYRTSDGKPTSRYYWMIAIDDVIDDLPPVVRDRLTGETSAGEPGTYERDDDVPL